MSPLLNHALPITGRLRPPKDMTWVEVPWKRPVICSILWALRPLKDMTWVTWHINAGDLFDSGDQIASGSSSSQGHGSQVAGTAGGSRHSP